MTIFVAAVIGLTTVFAEAAATWRLVAVAIVFLVTGTALLRLQPPDLDTRFNHFVIAVPYLGAAAIFWGAEASPGIAIGAAMFISPLAAVRLQNQMHFFVHLVLATLTLGAAGAIGHLPVTTLIGILCTVLAIWVLGISCWEILQSAEAQGDELERLVRRDPLTGVGNLRLLDETLPEEIQRHARAGKPLSILCMDLTGFKALNDQMGHAEGDALLREVGTALSSVARPLDTVVRQGGDEFCMILAETSAEHSVRMGNAVRAALADLHFEGITTGIGIASFPADAVDARTLLHVGDERLLADKAARKLQSRGGGHPLRRASDFAPADGAPLAQLPRVDERRGGQPGDQRGERSA